MDEWKDYLDELSEEKRRIVLDVMGRAMTYAPDSIAVMSYGVPTLKYKGKGIFAVAANT